MFISIIGTYNCGKIPDIEDALKRWDRNMKLLQHTIQPFQGIKECLQSLLSRGYILGIVTSKTYQEYYSDFEPLGLADYFSTIVFIKELMTAYSVSINVPSMSNTICLYFMCLIY